jgi:CheY-like chemotaxis protein
MKQSKIFYLDDDNDLLEMFANNVQEWGFKIDTFNDPKVAFNILEKHANQYDVLLIDYRMPLINGVDFLCMLHENNYFGIQNIALFSSMANTTDVQDELRNKIPNAKEKVACIDKSPNNLDELKCYLTSKITQIAI